MRQINATNLCLLLKIPNPESPSDFRPIACCNGIYETITKLMSARLQSILPSIICSNQGAFAQGRLIMSNVLICQDITKGYNRSEGQPKCLIKIDLRKAYDSLAWKFIEQVLQSLNFPAQFIYGLMLCVSTAQYSIVLNGTSFGYFKGGRGIRQGDPISPYIFVICMEVLSRLFNQASLEPRFKFHPGYKSSKLNHLMFADDFMLICAADVFSPT